MVCRFGFLVLLSAGLSGGLGACVFDPSAPPQAQLTCDDEASCPPDFVCTLGVCVPTDAPVAVPLRLRTAEDTSLALALEGSGTAFRVTAPPRGVLTLDEDGVGSYTPLPNDVGTDTFSFIVSRDGVDSAAAAVVIDIDAVNDAPTLVGGTLTTAEDVPAGFDLAVADVDLDEVTLTVTAGPGRGTATIAGGVLFFTPAPDFFGDDAIEVTASDGTETASVEIDIRVTPVPDPPSIAPLAVNVPEDGEAILTPEITDPDGGGEYGLQIVSAPTRGTASIIEGQSGPLIQYRPTPDVTGVDQLVVAATRDALVGAPAVVTLAVLPVVDPPIADDTLISVDEDSVLEFAVTATSPDLLAITYSLLQEPAHGTLTLFATGTALYEPDPDYFGADSFAFLAVTGAASDEGVVTIDVRQVDDPPVVADVALEWRLVHNEDVVLGPAVDIDGEVITYAPLFADPRVAITGNVLSFTPPSGSCLGCPTFNAGFPGAESITMVADDGTGPAVTFTLGVNVTSPASCGAAFASGARTTGVYRIVPTNGDASHDAWCDMETAGGGWALAARFASDDADWFFAGPAWGAAVDDDADLDPGAPGAAKLTPFTSNLTEVLLEPTGAGAGTPILMDLRGESAIQRDSLQALIDAGTYEPTASPVVWDGFFAGFGLFGGDVEEGVFPPAFSIPIAPPECVLCGTRSGALSSLHGLGLPDVAVGQSAGQTLGPGGARLWIRDRDFTDDFPPINGASCTEQNFGDSPGYYVLVSKFFPPAAVHCPP